MVYAKKGFEYYTNPKGGNSFMQTKKVVSMIASMALVAVLAVAGTLAYLSKTSNEVKNTFVAANLDVTLLLDETVVELKDDSVPGDYQFKTPKANNRTTAQSYSLVPGVDVPKDPIVTVEGLNQKAYLFIEVVDTTPTTLTWTLDGRWTKLGSETGKNGGQIYYLNSAVNPNTGKQTFNIIEGEVVEVDSSYAKPTGEEALTYYAYLCQYSGFASASEAWSAVFK